MVGKDLDPFLFKTGIPFHEARVVDNGFVVTLPVIHGRVGQDGLPDIPPPFQGSILRASLAEFLPRIVPDPSYDQRVGRFLFHLLGDL